MATTKKNDMLELKKENFEENVLKSNEVVVVDFYATWCSPCKMIAPILEELAEKYAGKVNFYKVNAEEEADLSEQFGIMNLPTLLYFKNGEPIKRIVGGQPKEAIEAEIIALQ